MISVLVADDEHLARKTIKSLLKNQKDIGEIVEAENGTKVLELCNEQHFDIIFLDIQMPGYSGIELAEKISSSSVIVFVTAYDQYAIDAFDLNAVDYLLKPYDDERFYSALNKAQKQLITQSTKDYQQISALIDQLAEQGKLKYKSRLVIKEPGKIKLVDVDQIEFIQGAGNYADLFFIDGGHILHRETLTSLEKQLNPSDFVRIHRSSIVRKSRVQELRANDNGDYTVIVKSGQELTLSRRNRDKIELLTGE